MTGPTSVVSSAGSPIATHPCSRPAVRARDVQFPPEEDSSQSRTALTRAVETGLHDIQHHLLRQCGAIDDHRVVPACFRDDAAIGPCARQANARMSLAVCVDPVNATPAMRGSLTMRAPTVPPSPGSGNARRQAEHPPLTAAERPSSRSAASALRVWRSPHCLPRARRDLPSEDRRAGNSTD